MGTTSGNKRVEILMASDWLEWKALFDGRIPSVARFWKPMICCLRFAAVSGEQVSRKRDLQGHRLFVI
jgi:hypothetical protein